jgi:thiamine biosynthesis protein ThiS
MTITINGEPREIPDGLTISALLTYLELTAGRVAVERNREILPRDQWDSTSVAAGDVFEIVHFVGGG